MRQSEARALREGAMGLNHTWTTSLSFFKKIARWHIFTIETVGDPTLRGEHNVKFHHGSKADFTASHRDGDGHLSSVCVRASVHGPHSTVACTTILGSSMSFLLCTILSSS